MDTAASIAAVDDRRAKALHEAAHAVAAVGVGLVVQRVTIRPEPPDVGGYCRVVWSGSPGDRLCVVTAGMIVNEIAGLGLTPGRFRSDREQARGLIEAGADPRAALRRAERLLRRNWRAVLRIAEELLAAGEISGPDVCRLICSHPTPRRMVMVFGNVG